MNIEDSVSNEYFEWMIDLVCRNRFAKEISYRKLLAQLHGTEFTYLIPKDVNRAEDGRALRYRFAMEIKKPSIYRYLRGPCSVLEMMVALALRCEENIMDDPSVGDRTQQWFWGMIVNLGLGSMTDDIYDRRFVHQVLSRFLDREYDPDGRGGLFTVKNSDQDLRTAEIWYQLCWYLDNIV